jgi:hypothetical protein
VTETDFWKLISRIDTKALDRGDEEAAVSPLLKALSDGYGEKEMMAFEEILSQKLFAIDGEIYAKNAGESGESDDAFLYARLYIVAKGQKFYESVLANPKKIPKSLDQWCESLLYQHRIAWATLTGKDEADWPFEPSVSFESGSNPELWKS